MGFNANVLKMDKFGNVKPFTFILSTKNYKHLGQLNNVKIETIDFKCNLNGANELSFELYKKIEDEVEKLWDDITDLKSIYVPELDEYFEIQVAYNDKLEETKTVICKSLCESELSQTYMYGTEINTQTDSDRLDYSQTIFYDELNPKGSLLHRVLSFVPQYKIKHVDASLCKLQRSFSIDDTNVYDFLTGECAEQFNCLFVFDSTNRSISAYDLYTSCNECGHRDAYSFVCPKCGSTNINYFGNDTDIYIDKENFSDDIKLEVDVDSIKNCLRLRSGDDIMDEAIISMNPNGTRYIYYISDEQREDMSDELVNKIDEYDELVEQYTPEYQDLALDIRELQDRKTYYESTMMPSPIEDDEEIPSNSISNKEIAKLTQEKLSPVGMDELTTATTLDTVDIVVKNYAKVFVNSSLVKIDIVEGSTFTYKGKDKDDWDYGIWTGKIKLTAYSDANDVAITDTLTLTIHDNYGEFLQQKVMKEMALNDKEGSVFNVLDIEDFDEFKLALKEYCLSRLRSFHMALDTACITLVSLDQATENADWYEDIYVPYHNKLLACSDEILVRESQIKEIQDQLDILYARKSEIQSILNFENFLGEDLYIEFCTYRRESEYHNDNYISDGLSNAEIIDRAKEFIEVAKKELIRSATKKYTISTNLHNLLLMEEFKPLANKFALGNFIRVRVGKDLFRLRLNSYHLTFSDLSTIDVEFSDMTKSINVIDATQKILSDAQSMASNISYISKQAEKGEKANESVNNIVQNGLDSALTQIQNNVNQEFVIDNNGILGRRYDDITGKYEPEQVRITNNIIALTENNWVDTTCALGKHKYTYYDVDSKTFKQSIGFGLSSKFSQNSFIYGSQIIGGDIFSENYSPTTGTHINLNDGSFNFGHKIIYDALTNKMTMKDVDIEWDSTNPPKKSDIEGLEGYLEQLDGRIQTYSQPTDPSINWKTPEDKAKHDGDIWFDTTNGLTKRWNNTTGKWDIVTDSELKSLAQSKAQIFTSQPIPPYSIGDLWVEGKDGDIWHCIKSKESGSYTASDWEKSSKYTDDAKANEANEKIDNFQSNVNKALNVTLPTNKIGEDYIISPYIGGGYAYIANNDYSVEIDPNHTNSDSNGEYLFCVKDKSISDNSKNVIMGVTNNGNGYFKGDIIANEGSIGGIDITNDRLRSRNTMTEGIVGVQYEASIRKYNPDTENPTKEPAFLIRKRNYDGTSYDSSWEHIFKVTYEGKLTSLDATITGGNIGGFTIDGNSIHSGTWGTDNSVMMCTGTGGSKKIGGSDEISGWCFTAGSKFGVTKNGDVYASNVDITGKINAISGNMDSVTATNLTVTSGTIKLGDATINENGITIAGNQLGTSTISGWKVFNNRIAKLETSVNKGLPVSVGISCDSGNYAFWAGGADANGNASISGTDMDAGKYTDTFKPAFAVRQNGEIIATKGKIGDMSIHSDGSLGGSGMMIYPNGKKYNSFSNTYYISITYNGRMIALNQNGTWDTIY